MPKIAPRELYLHSRRSSLMGDTSFIMSWFSMAAVPARAVKLLEQMRRNPRGDWRIEELRSAALGYGLNVRSGRGSHVVFEHALVAGALTVPARRPTFAVALVDDARYAVIKPDDLSRRRDDEA